MTETTARTITVTTQDGECPVHLHTPVGTGPWPGAILFMDGPGMRPAVHEIAARLAGNGYAVALPDLFYRAGAYEPIDPKVVFGARDSLVAHLERFMTPLTPARAMADTRAVLDAMHEWPEFAPGPVGVVGYCMGGRLALIAAGTFPEDISVAASYHGGGLADDDQPTSPHLLAPNIRAKVYVGGAINDTHFTDEEKARLEQALSEAGVDHVIETYPALHGWVPRDMPAHDAAEAEHHWQTLVPLFNGVLKQG